MNSRNKGNRGERVAAGVMKAWTGKEFARVPSSGGLQWTKANAKGDIVCTVEGHFFPFCLEVKNYKGINFEHLLYLDKADIIGFWDQCVRDADIAKKCPMLMMRYDRLPKDFFFVCIPTLFYDFLQHHKYFGPEDKMLIVPHLGMTIITTTMLLKIPYKLIRKPTKALYR